MLQKKSLSTGLVNVYGTDVLGVNPDHVSQMLRDGLSLAKPNGSIKPVTVEWCRSANVWLHPQMKSGRRSASTLERERRDGLWYVVASKLRGQGNVSAVFGPHVIAYNLIRLGNLLEPAMAAA